MKKKMFFIIIFLLLWAVPPFATDLPMIKLTKVAVSSIPDEMILPDLGSVTIDPQGNVFAFAGKSDGNNCFVVKFDRDLKYLKHFGREGKGPSDFSVRSDLPEDRLMISATGDVYVIDHNPTRLVVFDNEGNYKTDIMFRMKYYSYFGHITKFKALGNNVFAGLKYVEEQPHIGIIFSLNPPRIITNYQYSGEVITVKGPFGHRQIEEPICGNHNIMDTDSQHVVFGDSQAYKFRVYDSSGTLILEVWDKNRKVRSFSDKEMKKIIDDWYTQKKENTAFENNYIEQLRANKNIYERLLEKIRENKNVIADIQITGDRIFVFPVGEDITRGGHFYPVEVYNLEGQVIKRGYFREIPLEIWQGFVFFQEYDEVDNPFIVKYKIDEKL